MTAFDGVDSAGSPVNTKLATKECEILLGSLLG